MSFHFEWLLNLEERIAMLRKTILYIYATKMSIAWAVAFFGLLILACYEIRNVFITYVFIATGGLVGIILSILMILPITEEQKEVVRLRGLYSKFINSLGAPGNTWDPSTKKAFLDFQDLFKRICPEVSTINLPGSELLEPTETMIEARKVALEQRKIRYSLNSETEKDKKP